LTSVLGGREAATGDPWWEMKKPRDDGPMFLTTDEVADLLRTTRKAVYAMIERGFLPGVVHLGRRVLVRRETLMEWLDRQERKTV
jgi:excisionase family DNA binding protein